MPKPTDLLQGTLDLLILKTLSREPLHGWAIAKRMLALSNDVLTVQQGSLYPALHRLEQRGWLKASWQDTDQGRETKVYAITRTGRKQLETEHAAWRRFVQAMSLVLDGQS
jgi:PadR family transcriptional regulator PadR